jgi:uncharacterized membrane protein required for colicin V production
MAIIVDLVILVVLFLCIYAGYKRGLAKCLINVLAFIIAVVVAAMLFKPASAIVRSNTEIDENIKTSIVNVFEEEEKEKKEDNEKESPIMEYLTEKAKDATEEKKKEIVENAANDISIKIVDVLSFIGIFIIVRFLLVFVKALADLITKLPLIKQCDKIGGVVYGILQALVIIFIALALITFISTAVNRYGLLELINQSYVGSILNNNNILLKIIF